MIKWIKIFFFISTVGTAHAQDWMGAVPSNYAGVDGVMFNPASIADSKLKFDMSIIGIEAHLDNNFVYFDTTNTFKFLNEFNTQDFILSNEAISESRIISSYNEELLAQENTKNKFMHLNSLVRFFPSFMVSKEQSGFGFYITYRNMFSMRGVHYSIAQALFEGVQLSDTTEITEDGDTVNTTRADLYLNYSPLQNQPFATRALRIAGMSWIEGGFSYASIVEDNEFYQIASGVTFKLDRGMGAVYVYNKKFDFEIQAPNDPDQQDLSIDDLEGRYGYTDFFAMTDSFQSEERKITDIILNGWGGGVDIGFSLEIKDRNPPRFARDNKIGIIPNEEIIRYKWKINAALIDIGAVNMNQQVENFTYTNAATVWQQVDTASIDSLLEFNDELAAQFPDINAVRNTSSNFLMQLPTAFTFSVDKPLVNNFHVSLIGVQRLPILKAAATRANELAIVPRYESRWIDVAFPVLLYEYANLKTGLAVRLGPLTLGTDHLGSFFGRKQWHGTDFYMSLRFNIAKLQRKASHIEPPKYKKRLMERNRKAKDIRCPY